MVEIKFVIEMLIIVVALGLLAYWIWTNYNGLSTQFFQWFQALPSLFGKG